MPPRRPACARRRGAATWLLLATAIAANAQAESLPEAWSIALTKDAGLASVSLQTESARASERAANAARWPSLEVGASYTRMDQAPALSIATPAFSFVSPPIFSGDDFHMRQAQLSVPLYAGGSLLAGERAARESRLAAEAVQRSATADLKLEVARRYLDVLRTGRALVAAEASVGALEAHVQDVTAMVEVQSKAQTDLLASRVAASAARQELARARLAATSALGQYNRHLGEPLDRPVQLEAVALAVDAPERDDLRSLQQRAVGQRGELAALEAQGDSLEAAARAEFGKQLPTIALTATHQKIETTVLDREEFAMISVGVRWALFDGGASRQRAAALRRSSESTRARRAAFESQIRLEVHEARLAIDEADARVALTRDAIADADENLRITRELYREELATNTQVLEAIALQTAAAGHAADAVADATLARLRLLRAIGEL